MSYVYGVQILEKKYCKCLLAKKIPLKWAWSYLGQNRT